MGKHISRPWSVTLIGGLLLFQALTYLILGVWQLPWFTFRWTFPWILVGKFIPYIIGPLFIGLSLLSLIAMFSFFQLWPIGWMSAVMVQGLSLGLSLYLHFRHNPFYVNLIMVFCIYLVIYLNYSDVLAAFRIGQSTYDNWRGKNEL
jgi:hypothetical protein